MGKDPQAFRTISEVADMLEVPQHVLRFWEGKFNQIKPMKRAGGRRYYRPNDITLLHTIKSLLYSEGYTIKGVQKLLKQKKIIPNKNQNIMSQQEKQNIPRMSNPKPSNEEICKEINEILQELKHIQELISKKS